MLSLGGDTRKTSLADLFRLVLDQAGKDLQSVVEQALGSSNQQRSVSGPPWFQVRLITGSGGDRIAYKHRNKRVRERAHCDDFPNLH
jgi:hypothetical protein